MACRMFDCSRCSNCRLLPPLSTISPSLTSTHGSCVPGRAGAPAWACSVREVTDIPLVCQQREAAGPRPWKGEPVTKIEVRAATEDDLAAIAAVAEATGQVEEWSGSDPAYVRHLLAHGQVLMAAQPSSGEVTGFGATRRIGDGPAAVTMLCDLFVDPGSHGRGTGQALLAELWEPGSPRMTFSSLHAHAVPVYTRAGLDAWWPLLY